MDKACGGTVLRCLADKIDDINDDSCKKELLYFQKMEVSLAEQILCFVNCCIVWDVDPDTWADFM